MLDINWPFRALIIGGIVWLLFSYVMLGIHYASSSHQTGIFRAILKVGRFTYTRLSQAELTGACLLYDELDSSGQLMMPKLRGIAFKRLLSVTLRSDTQMRHQSGSNPSYRPRRLCTGC